MKKELTDELLEAMAKCSKTSGDCSRCGAYEFCRENSASFRFEKLATALLEERAKPKVWDGAPENATLAEVVFKRECGELFELIHYEEYTRELPKTRARQIAEQEGHGLAEKYGWNEAAKELVTNKIEAALNKYAEELEGK